MNFNGVELTTELMEKLNNVDSLEKLKALVKEAGLEVADEELAEYFDEELKALKLPAEDLDRVSGDGFPRCKRKNCGSYKH